MSPSAVSQGLAFLAGQGLVVKVAHGLAEPEKALVDCLYVSAFRKRQFSYFPELRFPKSFSLKKAYAWTDAINSRRAALHARRRLEFLKKAR